MKPRVNQDLDAKVSKMWDLGTPLAPDDSHGVKTSRFPDSCRPFSRPLGPEEISKTMSTKTQTQ